MSATHDTLTGTVHRPADLSQSERSRMFVLLHDFFENVSRAQFEADLAEKEWVFVFRDSGGEGTAGRIWGFSTLMRIDISVDDQPVIAVYSGDTIIHPDYWHELELPKIWGSHVFTLAEEIQTERPEAKVYWFLISSGYKTYRFLPVFFKEYFPSYRQETPPHIQRILDALGRYKFADQYDPESGIIRLADASPLKDGVAVVDDRRLKNRDIAYFVQRNPGYAQGEQLACLVEISKENVTAAGRRMLGG